MHNTIARGKHCKDSRQQAFIDAATAVFAEKGYESATTREVAERAGCSEGLIHRYFGGKRGLLLAMLEHKSGTIAESLANELQDRGDVREEIEELLLWTLEQARLHADSMRVSAVQGIIDPEIGQMIGRRLNDERVRAVSTKLRRHQEAGRIGREVEIEAAAQLISGFAFHAGFFLQVVFENDPEEVRRVVRESAKIIARGLMPPPKAKIGRKRRFSVPVEPVPEAL